MKKVVLMFAFVITFLSTACADNYKPVTKEQLPAKAQTFLSTYFGDAKISLARKDLDFLEVSYDVIFSNGQKVEFDKKGNWQEVDCMGKAIPAGIVPTPIMDFVKSHYAGMNVVKIEMDRNDYEVKLSNQVELTFNKKFQLVDID